MPGDVDMAERIEREVPSVVNATPIYLKLNT